MLGVLDLRTVNGRLQMLLRYQITNPPNAEAGTKRETTTEDRWVDVPEVKSQSDTSHLERFKSTIKPPRP